MLERFGSIGHRQSASSRTSYEAQRHNSKRLYTQDQPLKTQARM